MTPWVKNTVALSLLSAVHGWKGVIGMEPGCMVSRDMQASPPAARYFLSPVDPRVPSPPSEVVKAGRWLLQAGWSLASGPCRLR